MYIGVDGMREEVSIPTCPVVGEVGGKLFDAVGVNIESEHVG